MCIRDRCQSDQEPAHWRTYRGEMPKLKPVNHWSRFHCGQKNTNIFRPRNPHNQIRLWRAIRWQRSVKVGGVLGCAAHPWRSLYETFKKLVQKKFRLEYPLRFNTAEVYRFLKTMCWLPTNSKVNSQDPLGSQFSENGCVFEGWISWSLCNCLNNKPVRSVSYTHLTLPTIDSV